MMEAESERCHITGFQEGGREPPAKELPERGKEKILLEPPERNADLPTSDLSLSPVSDIENREIKKNVCCSKPPSLQ